MDAFGGSRVKTLPPEKGVFPLDHEGECKSKMKTFLQCLKTSKGDHFPCKSVSKEYLQCRMDVGLMQSEDLNNLGLGAIPEYVRTDANEGNKEKGGFVSGLGVLGSTKWSYQKWSLWSDEGKKKVDELKRKEEAKAIEISKEH
mmetsp:Transcript_28069/g.26932  ORF Transcript_28069/g.26932 Transcript_28069/m.26932 type:complete len:143 (+) Transcript_28069:136-564(+)